MTTLEEPPFDLVGFRTAQAKRSLAKIPARFADEIDLLPQVRDWTVAYLADPAKAKSLVLSGPTGTGKSHQAYQAIRTVVLALAERGLPPHWLAISHPALNDAHRPQPDGSHTIALAPYLEPGLVFLDDVGAGKQTEWTGDVLYRLVDHRWANCLPTVYATNLTPSKLAAEVGDRVTSRLADAVQVTVKGGDRRWSGGCP